MGFTMLVVSMSAAQYEATLENLGDAWEIDCGLLFFSKHATLLDLLRAELDDLDSYRSTEDALECETVQWDEHEPSIEHGVIEHGYEGFQEDIPDIDCPNCYRLRCRC